MFKKFFIVVFKFGNFYNYIIIRYVIFVSYVLIAIMWLLFLRSFSLQCIAVNFYVQNCCSEFGIKFD